MAAWRLYFWQFALYQVSDLFTNSDIHGIETPVWYIFPLSYIFILQFTYYMFESLSE
jgi:hypothetical protein